MYRIHAQSEVGAMIWTDVSTKDSQTRGLCWWILSSNSARSILMDAALQ